MAGTYYKLAHQGKRNITACGPTVGTTIKEALALAEEVNAARRRTGRREYTWLSEFRGLTHTKIDNYRIEELAAGEAIAARLIRKEEQKNDLSVDLAQENPDRLRAELRKRIDDCRYHLELIEDVLHVCEQAQDLTWGDCGHLASLANALRTNSAAAHDRNNGPMRRFK